jgi:hypothetical protein
MNYLDELNKQYKAALEESKAARLAHEAMMPLKYTNWRQDPDIIRRELETRHAMQAAAKECRKLYTMICKEHDALDREAREQERDYAALRAGM